MPTRSPNPVQMIQGYVQRGEAVTIPTRPPETVNLQKSYPDAAVTVLYRRPGVAEPEFAAIFNRDGTPKNNPFQADSNAYYSFYAQPGRYDIEFSGGEIGTPFKFEDVPVESLVFNVRDYGAKGDGVTDDTLAIRAALNAMVAAHNEIHGVGTLFFPNGRYKVSKQGRDTSVFKLPSGIIIQGTAGPYTGGAANNCQIVLTSRSGSIFHIGTDRHKIVIRDLAMTSEHGRGTAIEAKETTDLLGTFTSGLEFDNLTIWGFEKGLAIEGSGEALQWDITGVRVNHCNITECHYSVYVDSQNCSFMRIVDSRIGAKLNGFGIYLEKVGIITIDSILGAGFVDEHGTMCDTFIYLTAARGTVTMINCECEGFAHSIQVTSLATGNIAWPIVLLNCGWGPEIFISSQCDVVSVGSRYLPQTVQCDPLAEDARFFSFGDVIIGLDKVENSSNDFHLSATSRMAARANRYRVDFGLPTRIGGQAGQPPANANNLTNNPALAVAPFAAGQAQIALCNQAGLALYNVRAEVNATEGDAIYFTNARTGAKLMKLDSNGNLTVKGNVTPNTIP